MTYRQLRRELQNMQETDLDQDATMYDRDNDEYMPVKSFKKVGEEQDVLDAGSHVIVVGE